MPDNGQIDYDYNVLLDGIAKMNNCNKSIEQAIEKLANETGTALDNWTGSAADHYNTLSKDLSQRFGDMNHIVHQLATTVHIKSQDMQDQDVRSGNRFGTH